MSFTDLISRLDARPGVRGRQFERICAWYLRNAPEYRGRLKRVWLWADWPGAWAPDAGIALVAREHDGVNRAPRWPLGVFSLERAPPRAPRTWLAVRPLAEEHGGGLWAIQAKAYAPDYAIKKADVDAFQAEAGRPGTPTGS